MRVHLKRKLLKRLEKLEVGRNLEQCWKGHPCLIFFNDFDCITTNANVLFSFVDSSLKVLKDYVLKEKLSKEDVFQFTYLYAHEDEEEDVSSSEVYHYL